MYRLIGLRDTVNRDDYLKMIFYKMTDQYTVHEQLFPDEIRYKGFILNQMTKRWMKMLQNEGIVGNYLLPSDYKSLIRYGFYDFEEIIATKPCVAIPLECIVRGYFVSASSSWNAYKKTRNMYGHILPYGLTDSQQLSYPIYTPSTKSKPGENDINITFEESIDVICDFLKSNFILRSSATPKDVAEKIATDLREKSLAVYKFAHNYAINRGIILADTKLEFGISYNTELQRYEILLINEVLTPSTSRFWDIHTYSIGQKQFNMDKSILINYVENIIKWNRKDKPPRIPDTVRETVTEIYCDIFERLFDENVVNLSIDAMWEWKEAYDEIEEALIDAKTKVEIDEYFGN